MQMISNLVMVGIGACLVISAVFVTVFVPNVFAQNASEGSDIPTNATGAAESPAAINDTLTSGVGSENETVITP